MFKSINTILFATNLDENCQSAFYFAASISTRYQATLVMVHVLEELSNDIDGRLKALLGEDVWEKMNRDLADDSYVSLVGKRSTSKFIRHALNQFCDNSGINDKSCDYHSREIVVADGVLVDEIIDQAVKHKADLIVMGASEGLISGFHIGSTIKSVMKRSHIPVLIVPPNE